MYEKAAFRENQASTAKRRTGSSHNFSLRTFLHTFCLSNVVKKSRRWSKQTFFFLWFSDGPVGAGAGWNAADEKNKKATGLNRHLLYCSSNTRLESFWYILTWQRSESGIRVSSASCRSEDLLQINLHLSPGSFSGHEGTKQYCSCWPALFCRLSWLFGRQQDCWVGCVLAAKRAEPAGFKQNRAENA